jgi:hypothetical protein
MNTYTLSVSTNESQINSKLTLDTIELFDTTEFTLKILDVYSDIFPNYVGIDWGDNTPVLEPDIKVHRDYRTESIFPEIRNGGAPVFLVNTYTHNYYPSKYALKKSLILKLNVGYITGETTQLSAPINVRTNSYYESVDDLELIGLDLLDTTNNSSRFTFLTKKDNYIVQMDNKSYKGD